MERKPKNVFGYSHFPLFYVVTLLCIMYFMIHFAHYDNRLKIPSPDNFEVAEAEEIPTPKPLPKYDYNTLTTCDYSRKIRNPRLDVNAVIRKFQGCSSALLARFLGWPEGMMRNWQTSVSVCDEQRFVMDIELRDIGAGSWAILPACQEKNTLVVMGVRNNTTDIDHLLKKIPNLETYGADPFLKKSPNIKKFFNFALSQDDQTTVTIEHNGVNKTVASKGIKEFFENDLKLKRIDMLHINPTYGNFPFWDYTQTEGLFKKMGITICQMMIEVPKNKGQEWVYMISSLHRKSDFIFMRPRTLPDGSARAFFANVKDARCRRKYFE